MSRLRHKKASGGHVMAGSLSGVHRLQVDKPHPFKPDEEKKHGGKIHGHAHHHKLGRKRGGSVKKKTDGIGHGHHGTDATPDRGLKFGTNVQGVPMSGTESGYGGKTAFGKGHIEDSLKRGGSVEKKRDEGGSVTTVAKTTPSEPPENYDTLQKSSLKYLSNYPYRKARFSGPAAVDLPESNKKLEDRLHEKDGGRVKWIQHAINPAHKGMEQRAAKKAGVSTHQFMEKHKRDSGKSGARARLGLRLSAMHKHKD